jgi:hypothetical protein
MAMFLNVVEAAEAESHVLRILTMVGERLLKRKPNGLLESPRMSREVACGREH